MKKLPSTYVHFGVDNSETVQYPIERKHKIYDILRCADILVVLFVVFLKKL